MSSRSPKNEITCMHQLLQRSLSNAWRFGLWPAELPLRHPVSAIETRFLEVYVFYCFVLRNLRTNETDQKINHTIGLKIGLELRPQDRRNLIWAPIEKKIEKFTTDAIWTRAPRFARTRSARILRTQSISGVEKCVKFSPPGLGQIYFCWKPLL